MGRNNKYFFPSGLSVATGDWSVDGRSRQVQGWVVQRPGPVGGQEGSD